MVFHLGDTKALEALISGTIDRTVSEIEALFPSLIPRVAKAKGSGVVLAGHYCVAENLGALSYESPIEQKSLEAGVRLVQWVQERGEVCRLVLWVNDIGIDTAHRARLKESYSLPTPYRRILDKHRFDPLQVNVLFESTMRNKGSTWIRKIERQDASLIRRVPSSQVGLVRCVNDYQCEIEAEISHESIVIRGPDGRDLVLKEDTNPKCCLILGTLFSDVTKQFDANYIVNIFNNLYAARLDYGTHVAREVFQLRLPIWNYFVDD